MSLTEVDAAIAVSHCNKENLTLRARIDPSIIYVIPNALNNSNFYPMPEVRAKEPKERINIVFIGRLTFRKGIDLLVDLIPLMMQKHPELHLIVGGPGYKDVLIKEIREKYNLGSRLELLGAIPHTKVAETMNRGDIFINTSLTEAFGIVNMEAYSCGLICVATRVGGVQETLPPSELILAAPNAQSLSQAVDQAIEWHGKRLKMEEDQLKELKWKQHMKVKELYSWDGVLRRTKIVYDVVMEKPMQNLAN